MAIVPLSWGGYFQRGGFEISREDVRLRSRFGTETTLPCSAVAAVVFAQLPRFDSRVLLVDAAGRLLAQDPATFYDDTDLDRLASALGVPLQKEQLPTFKRIHELHPDLFRYKWMFHPYRTGIVVAVGLFAVLTILVTAVDGLR